MACPSHGTMGLPNVTYCCIREAEEPNHCGTCSSSCRTGSCSAGPRPSGPRYTKALLCQTLQLLGCKPRHSEKACAKVFLILQQRAALAPSEQYSLAPTLRTLRPGTCSVTLTRAEFEHLVLESLAPHDPSAALFSDLPMACSLQERRRCVTILLCGTSGTGKSTLASLLASRFGISTVVSTDSIRHMLRGFAALEDQPLLWTSTYQAGAALAQREKPPSTLALGAVNGDSGEKHAKVDGDCGGDEEVDVALAVEGYTRQSEAVMGSVERLVAASEARRESSILEGVHLSPALAVRLMAKHPSVVPFLIHISNEAKHLERFAVRAKAMTLRPEGEAFP